MENTGIIYYWIADDGSKINIDEAKKVVLVAALKEMIKLSSLEESANDRYELSRLEPQFSEGMLDYQPEDKES